MLLMCVVLLMVLLLACCCYITGCRVVDVCCGVMSIYAIVVVGGVVVVVCHCDDGVCITVDVRVDVLFSLLYVMVLPTV